MSSTKSTFSDVENEKMENTGLAMLPYAFMLRPSLECALFPDLFLFSFWCDRFVQVASRHSVKENLCANISSDIVDYAADQFASVPLRQMAVEQTAEYILSQ